MDLTQSKRQISDWLSAIPCLQLPGRKRLQVLQLIAKVSVKPSCKTFSTLSGEKGSCKVYLLPNCEWLFFGLGTEVRVMQSPMAFLFHQEAARDVQLWDRAASSLASQAASLDTVGKANMWWLRLAFGGDNRKLHGGRKLMSEVVVSSSLNLALNVWPHCNC